GVTVPALADGRTATEAGPRRDRRAAQATARAGDDAGHARAAGGQPAADVPPPPRRVPPAEGEGRARRARRLAAVTQGRTRRPADVRPVAGLPREPADGAGDGQPPVARLLRPRDRPH